MCTRAQCGLSAAARRLLDRVGHEAAVTTRRTELGASTFAFARVVAMSAAELEARGCPAGEPLLRFPTKEVVDDLRSGYPDTADQRAEFIREISALQWGGPEGSAAFLALARSRGSRRIKRRAWHRIRG
jgi:hypothetical protein